MWRNQPAQFLAATDTQWVWPWVEAFDEAAVGIGDTGPLPGKGARGADDVLPQLWCLLPNGTPHQIADPGRSVWRQNPQLSCCIQRLALRYRNRARVTRKGECQGNELLY